MVQLVPMSESEFQEYLSYAVAEYAQGHVEAGGWTQDEALQRATDEYRQLLPDGVTSKSHYLYTIRNEEGQNVGMLWLAVRPRGKGSEAFIYDVRISEQFQRRGYGSQAFRAMEEKVRELGLNSISLHVFGHNHPARQMYQKLGYIETNVLMTKKLDTRPGK
ncbi:MAG: GNAT family N-acetyltransferase [Ktedonobacteraceae bacterium]|nr:GNAT family N-acetyltransferase [Ktedonobacteraceae bacterium]